MKVATGPLLNYLVPAAGSTHGVFLSDTWTATPQEFDPYQFSIDNFPFIPQGVFIDNSQGTAELVIQILPVGYFIRCAPGISRQVQFPAVKGARFEISGLGVAVVTFVDFPVLPDAGQVNVGNKVSVDIASFSYAGSLPVLPPVNIAGIPYQVTKIPNPAALAYSNQTITGAVVSATVVPTSGILQRLKISTTPNATFAASGVATIIGTLGGVQIFKFDYYLGAGGGSDGVLMLWDEDYSDFDFGGGNLVITTSTALATGALSINATYVG